MFLFFFFVFFVFFFFRLTVVLFFIKACNFKRLKAAGMYHHYFVFINFKYKSTINCLSK